MTQDLAQHAIAGLAAADLTARMLLQRSGMEAAVAQLVTDEALQQQLQGVVCTPYSSDAELLNSLHGILHSQLMQQSGSWESPTHLSLLHLAGLVAGAVKESSTQEQQQQQQQQTKQQQLPVDPGVSVTALVATAASAAAEPSAAAGEQQQLESLQDAAAPLAPRMLWDSQRAELAVLHLAVADPALQQQLLGVIHTAASSPRERIAGMRLLLHNYKKSAVKKRAAINADIWELASLVEAACRTLPAEEQQQQQQQPGVLSSVSISDGGHSAAPAAAEAAAADAAAAAGEQHGLTGVPSPTVPVVPQMWDSQGAEKAVLQLAAGEPVLQQQLLGVVNTPVYLPRERLCGMRLQLRNYLCDAVARGAAVRSDVLELAELVEAACRTLPAEEHQQQQQQQPGATSSVSISDQVYSAAPAAAAAAGEQHGLTVVQSSTVPVVPQMLWDSQGAETAVLQLAAGEPALQQQLLGVLNAAAKLPRARLHGMRLQLRNYLCGAVTRTAAVHSDVLELAELVEAACRTVLAEEYQQQQQQLKQQETHDCEQAHQQPGGVAADGAAVSRLGTRGPPAAAAAAAANMHQITSKPTWDAGRGSKSSSSSSTSSALQAKSPQQQHMRLSDQSHVPDTADGEAATAAAAGSVRASPELLTAIVASWPIDAPALETVATADVVRLNSAEHTALQALLVRTAALMLACCPGHCADFNTLRAMVRNSDAWVTCIPWPASISCPDAYRSCLGRVQPQLHLEELIRADPAFTVTASMQAGRSRTLVKLQPAWLLPLLAQEQQQMQQEILPWPRGSAWRVVSQYQVLMAIDAVWPVDQAAVAAAAVAARAGAPPATDKRTIAGVRSVLQRTAAQQLVKLPCNQSFMSALSHHMVRSPVWAAWRPSGLPCKATVAYTAFLSSVSPSGGSSCLQLRRDVAAHPAFAVWVDGSRAERVRLRVEWLLQQQHRSRHAAAQGPAQQQEQRQLLQHQQQLDEEEQKEQAQQSEQDQGVQQQLPPPLRSQLPQQQQTSSTAAAANCAAGSMASSSAAAAGKLCASAPAAVAGDSRLLSVQNEQSHQMQQLAHGQLPMMPPPPLRLQQPQQGTAAGSNASSGAAAAGSLDASDPLAHILVGGALRGMPAGLQQQQQEWADHNTASRASPLAAAFDDAIAADGAEDAGATAAAKARLPCESKMAAQLDGSEQLHLPGYGSVLLLPPPASLEAAAALKQNFVYALITVDSSYLLQLLQPQQSDKLAVLMRLDSSDRASMLQQPHPAQLLDGLNTQYQIQQQHDMNDVSCEDHDEGCSMLYIPTDDEDC